MTDRHHPKNVSCENCAQRTKGIFCDLEENALREMGHSKIMNTYKKGSVLFHQGNPPFGLYCVNSGKIKISKIGTDGKESIVRIARPGDILGHRSLFSNENYTATATTLEDAVICFIDKKSIYQAVHDHPSIALRLIQKLSAEMGAAEAKSASMYQKNVRERLAELLLNLEKSYGVQEAGRVRLDIKLTREEMASMIGTSSETVIRLFTEFKDEGLIEQEGKTIFVLDDERLLSFANVPL